MLKIVHGFKMFIAFIFVGLNFFRDTSDRHTLSLVFGSTGFQMKRKQAKQIKFYPVNMFRSDESMHILEAHDPTISF